MIFHRLRLFGMKKFSPVKIDDLFYANPYTIGQKDLQGVGLFDDIRMVCVAAWPERFYFRLEALQLSLPGPEIWKVVGKEINFERDEFYNLILERIVRKQP